MLWAAGDDPIRFDALMRMPLIEYYILLDKKISDVKKQNR